MNTATMTRGSTRANAHEHTEGPVARAIEQANLPGTTDAHPNWRRQLSCTLEEIIDGGELHRVAGLIEEARRRSAKG